MANQIVHRTRGSAARMQSFKPKLFKLGPAMENVLSGDQRGYSLFT